jgi:xanthine dehydrogenase accessory factor
MIRDTIRVLLDTLRAGRPVVVCRLVETRGSTPQKAGATMLVYSDGAQAGTLGGGCVEAEVKRQALQVLATGDAKIVPFVLDHDYGWDDGLICGGRMQVLMQPTQGNGTTEYLTRFGELVERGAGLTEAIVFDEQAAPLCLPSSYLFDEQRQLIVAWNTETRAPEWLVEQIKPLDDRPRPYVVRGISLLPHLPRCRLVIVGGGHVGKAVADLAYDLDFDVWVVDDRAEYASAERFPRAQRHIVGNIHEVLPHLEVDRNTYCLIVTRGHNHDEEALYYLVERDARYVGLIGSRRKIKMIFEDLLGEGISQQAIDRVYAPLGIDIGSQSVPEIAVSICAELISHRNRSGYVPGRPE